MNIIAHVGIEWKYFSKYSIEELSLVGKAETS